MGALIVMHMFEPSCLGRASVVASCTAGTRWLLLLDFQLIEHFESAAEPRAERNPSHWLSESAHKKRIKGVMKANRLNLRRHTGGLTIFFFTMLEAVQIRECDPDIWMQSDQKCRKMHISGLWADTDIWISTCITRKYCYVLHVNSCIQWDSLHTGEQ